MTLGFRINTETENLEWISKCSAGETEKNRENEYSGHESFFYQFDSVKEMVEFLKEKDINNGIYLDQPYLLKNFSEVK